MNPRRSWWLAAGAVSVGLLLAVVMLRWFEHNQVYHPSLVLEATGAELSRSFEDVYFRTTDGKKLNGWFFPADTNSPQLSLAVLVCHGNGGNISHRLDLCRALLAGGVNVLLFDYRGYGRSEGGPSEEGTYLDAQAAYTWLRKKGFTGTNILAYGESLGGGVATELTVREMTGGLILQSTFTSVPDVGAELFPWLPVRWLARIRYDTLSKLPNLRVPVLVMHSRSDEMIGFRHGQRNFAAANQPKLFWELNGGHNHAADEPAAFTAGFRKFLTLIETARSPSSASRKEP